MVDLANFTLAIGGIEVCYEDLTLEDLDKLSSNYDCICDGNYKCIILKGKK